MRRATLSTLLMLVILIFAAPLPALCVDTKDTRMVSRPAVSSQRIAFVYADNLWTADLDGSNVQPITMEGGVRRSPFFSPDGSLLAFSAERGGNVDVYLVPAQGGIPRRITWHPKDDIVQGFTPDGASVLFASRRRSLSFTALYRLYTIPVKGGHPVELPLPNGFTASYSSDGKYLAYNPHPDEHTEWKGYRGGATSRIWVYRFSDRSIEKLPRPPEGCNDSSPLWMEGRIYFRSDRGGEFNLFCYDPATKDVTQLTRHGDFPVLALGAGGGKIIYEQGGWLHLLDTRSGAAVKLTVGVAAELPKAQEQYVKNPLYIRSASISPTGARAAFEYRGEIITLPAEKGDPRNITNTPGAHERYPVWSPDGRSIAYFSDESGEYELCVRRQDGSGEARRYPVKGAGFYDNASWSPDSGKIAFTDNAWNLYWIDLKTGVVRKVAGESVFGVFKSISASWAPDSRWIAYTLQTADYLQRVYIYSIEKETSFPVTDGLSEAANPIFDESGRYLYFFASTDAGPVKQWFDLSTHDMRVSYSLYLAVLAKGTPSPLVKQSDEERGVREPAPAQEKPSSKPPLIVTIDEEGLSSRILPLPLHAGSYDNLQAGGEGTILYLRDDGDRASQSTFATGAESAPTLYSYSLTERKEETVSQNVSDFLVSTDRKKILYRSARTWKIVPSSGKGEAGKGRLAVETLETRINPPVEWEQIFNEAWRLNRDYFYDPGMHGVDWKGVREKYRVFLPHLACRGDLIRVLQWMGSELQVGHHFTIDGDLLLPRAAIPCGLLGADYAVENGRYRFRKIYGGMNWYPLLRAPLTEPGVEVKEGEYLLAVNGRDLKAGTNIFSLFENTAGKLIEITVGPDPSGARARTVTVVPVEDEGLLHNQDWIEGNMRTVERATAGRVAYVYVPNTAQAGHAFFKRYFFPQAQKEAVIIDERFNGGGMYADYYLDILRRSHVCYFAMRFGSDFSVPGAMIEGPKVMLIDESAGSGGDLLPWTFRKLGLGKLVGTRTWGGLVGILGIPRLMDGSITTVPNFAAWDGNGWLIENVGVAPDIEVEQLPALTGSGGDPQLEKAIEVVMEELQKSPPRKASRPPYPVKGR